MGADEAQSHRSGEDAAEGCKQEESLGFIQGKAEVCIDGAGERGVVEEEGRAAGLLAQRSDFVWKDGGGGGEQGAALGAALAIRHMVDEEGVGARIQLGETVWIVVSAANQGEGEVAGLPEGLPGEARESRGVADLACLQRRLQAAGVGEPARWEGRVGELQEPPAGLHGGHLKERVELRQRQPAGGRAGEQHPVGAHFVALRIYRYCGQRIIESHVPFCEPPATADRAQVFI